MQHISLNVVDNDAAVEFCTEVLGLTPIDRPDFGFPGAWLEAANGVQIHLLEAPDFEAPSGPHLAFETDDIDTEVGRLRDLGVDVNDPSELNGAKQAFFFDPSGNQYELNEPAR